MPQIVRSGTRITVDRTRNEPPGAWWQVLSGNEPRTSPLFMPIQVDGKDLKRVSSRS